MGFKFYKVVFIQVHQFIFGFDFFLDAEKKLFVYYKCYRANVRAKVNSLRAKSALDEAQQKNALLETEKYLHLMESYLNSGLI